MASILNMFITVFEFIVLAVSLAMMILIVGYVQLEKDDRETKTKFKVALVALLLAYIFLGFFY